MRWGAGWLILILAFLLPFASPLIPIFGLLPAYTGAKLLRKDSWRFALVYIGWCLLVFGVSYGLIRLVGYSMRH